jgi:hypothetical protein
VSTPGPDLALLSISVEVEPTVPGDALAVMAAGSAATSSVWNARVESARQRFHRAFDSYRAELATVLSVEEEQINESAYPTIKVPVGGRLQALPLGDELFLDLFTLYAAGGWGQVEAATTAVAAWSGVQPADMKPREASLPGGVDLDVTLPSAAAKFYRECRLLLAEFVMQEIRDIEARVQETVRARLDVAIESVAGAIKTFGIHYVPVLRPVGGGVEMQPAPRMADPKLAGAIHHYLVQVGAARQRIEAINARLSDLRNGAPVGSPQSGGIGSGASHAGYGGSDSAQSEAELLAELQAHTRLAVDAGRQLQVNAPWAMAIAAQMTASTSEEDMLYRLDATLADIKATAVSMRSALDHDGVLGRYLGTSAEVALSAAYPAGMEAVMVRRALADVAGRDFAAVHLLCERTLVELYENEALGDGIRSVVLGRMIGELLQVAAEEEEARRERDEARKALSVVDAVLGLMVFIPVGGQIGLALRVITELSDVAMMFSAAFVYAEQYDDLQRMTAVRLAEAGEGDIAALGELLAMRRNLLAEIAMEVLLRMVSRSAGRVRQLKKLIFVRGALQDAQTLMEAIHSADEAAGP